MVYTQTKMKSSWVTCRTHNTYDDSFHHQVPETLPVTNIQMFENLGCEYFQGYIGVHPQELQNSSGAFPTGGSR